MPTVLVAPNAFKSTAAAPEVARLWAGQLRQKGLEVDVCPVADGGDGTLDVLEAAIGGTRVACRVTGPLGRPVEASWLHLRDGRGFVESAAACGLRLLEPGEVGALEATTLGVGELIADAARTCTALVVGVGGTASSDGGAGALVALAATRPPGWREAPLEVAVDVTNPLLGPDGAVAVFGPQKGLEGPLLAEAESRLAAMAASWPDGPRFASQPGAGAGGGLAFGLVVGCGGTLRPGFELVADTVGLVGRIRRCDAVLTGEGRLDSQSFMGKATGSLARLALEAGKRVFVLAGSAEEAVRSRMKAEGIVVETLTDDGMTVEMAMAAGPDLLAAAAGRLAGALST